MITINITLGIDLHIVDHKIHIKRSTENARNNAFEIHDNGIYMDDRIVANGNGFKDQNGHIVRVGHYGPYDVLNEPEFRKSGRVSANCIVHRVYTATRNEDNTYNVENFRYVDSFIPGDMLRVSLDNGKHEYRLITKTTSTDDRRVQPQQTYGMNNRIVETVLLGTW